jgi:hypothetical protein
LKSDDKPPITKTNLCPKLPYIQWQFDSYEGAKRHYITFVQITTKPNYNGAKHGKSKIDLGNSRSNSWIFLLLLAITSKFS